MPTALPGVPTKVERGGDWTLQRLQQELQPYTFLWQSKRLHGIRKALDKLTKNDGEAAKVFGKDHRVRPMAPKPRKVWDLYVDTRNGDLAKNGASLRIRIENGTAQISIDQSAGYDVIQSSVKNSVVAIGPQRP